LAIPVFVSAEPGWLKDAIERADSVSVAGDAPAVVLLHEAQVEIRSNGSAQREVRIVFKVLEPKGRDEAVCAESVSSRRKVKGLKGWRIEPSGKSHSLESEHKIELGATTDASYHDDSQVLVAAFDEVNSGDVVAFEYSVHYESGLDGLCQGFLFQSDLPVVSTRLTVELPSGWLLCRSERNTEPIKSSVEGDHYVWESGFLPYREEEPFMLPWAYAVRSISFGAYDPAEPEKAPIGTWEAVSHWAWGLHEDKDGAGDSLQVFLADRFDSLSGPVEKFEAVTRFVRDDIRYVAVEIEHGRHEPRPASTTLRNRYGDCKDKVTLLRSLLKQAGIEALPVLACVGEPVDPDYPTPCQFNHVIGAVPLGQLPSFDTACDACLDGWLYVDPTQTFVEPGQLPFSLYGSNVLRLSDSGGVLVKLPPAHPEDNRRVRKAEARLTADGEIRVEVRSGYYGYARTKLLRRHQEESVDDRLDALMEYYANSMRSPLIDGYACDHNTDSAWVSYTLTSEHYPTETGGLRLLKVNLFHLDGPDELKKSDERQHDIWFGPAGRLETEVVWHLPSQWTMADKEIAVADSCAIGRVSARVSTADSGLVYLASRTYTGGVMPSSSIDEARSFQSRLKAVGATRVLIEDKEGGENEPSAP